MGWAQDGQARGRPLKRKARVETKPPLPLTAGRADEAGGGPGRVLGRDAVLHGLNRTRSDDLCKRGPDTVPLGR